MTDIDTMDPAAFTTVAFDFDGVLHPYSRGWHDGTCYDPPALGAIAALEAVMAERPVAIMTARPIDPIGDWLDQYAPHLRYVLDQNMFFDYWADRTSILITNRKIVAAHYIDDRALRFGPHPIASHIAAWDEVRTAIDYWDAENARNHADRLRCSACGEPVDEGAHGMSEYGGCV